MRKIINHSVDPIDLAARLAQIPSERGSPIRHLSPTSSPEAAEIELETGPREYQARCYHHLLEEGGRPLFHVDLLPQISENVDEYHDLLRSWRLYPDSPNNSDWQEFNWQVFHRQLLRWQEFRLWQLNCRGRTIEFPEYLYQHQRQLEMMGSYRFPASLQFEQATRRQWEREHGRWQTRLYDNEEEAKALLLKYINDIKNLLMDYGIFQPFQPHVDPKQQDQLTTFVEYLGFECFRLDLFTRSVKMMQPKPVIEQRRSLKVETYAQAFREQKQPEREAAQESTSRIEKIIPPTPPHSDTVQEQDHEYEEAKARVTYQQYRVDWVLSEIRKIEVEQKLASESASLVETTNSNGKSASDGNIDPSAMKRGRTDERGVMVSRKSDKLPVTQAEEPKIPVEKVIPKSQPNKTNHSASDSVSLASTGISHKSSNDRLQTLRPRANGKVVAAAGKPSKC